MISFIKQYIKLINYAMIGIVFAFASFYLLLNAYHYLEVRKTFDMPIKDETIVKSLDKHLEKITADLSTFKQNDYHGKIATTRMMAISQNLKSCSTQLQNETITKLKEKNSLDIRDVYHLRESFENDVVGGCLVPNLLWISNIDESIVPDATLIANSKLITMYIDQLRLEATNYLKKDLLNNSSYFFNTSITTSSTKNNVKDGFYEVMASYNDAAKLIEYLSDWFANEVKEGSVVQ